MPMQIEIKESSVFTMLCYDEMLQYESWYKETKEDNVRQAFYKVEYHNAKEMYQKALQFDRMEPELKTRALTIN